MQSQWREHQRSLDSWLGPVLLEPLVRVNRCEPLVRVNRCEPLVRVNRLEQLVHVTLLEPLVHASLQSSLALGPKWLLRPLLVHASLRTSFALVPMWLLRPWLAHVSLRTSLALVPVNLGLRMVPVFLLLLRPLVQMCRYFVRHRTQTAKVAQTASNLK